MDYRQMIGRHRSAMMGLAALMIIYYHAGGARGGLPLAQLAQAGVDIFVFVSGYGLARALSRPGEGYWRRRLGRCLPAYYVWFFAMLASLMAIKFVFRRQGDLQTFVLLHAFPWGVWVNRLPKVWYVSAVLGYYALAPLFFWLMKHARSARGMAALLILTAGILLPAQLGMDNVRIATLRLSALIAGLAVGLAQLREEGRQVSGLAWMAGLAALGVGLYLWKACPPLRHLDNSSRLRLTLNLCAPCACVALAYLMEAASRSPVQALVRLLEKLGPYSLEIYLVHVPVDALVRDHLKLSALPVLLILLITCFPLARLMRWMAGLLARAARRIGGWMMKPGDAE